MTDEILTTETTKANGAIDILVLRSGAPGLSAIDLRDTIEQFLPDRIVRLAETAEEERNLVSKAEIVVGNTFDQDLLRLADRLQLYAHVSTGTGALPLEAMERRGVAVTNAAGLMPCVAEQVIGYLLHFARDFQTGLNRQRHREWRHYRPGELNGSVVVVVGLGAIGTQVLDRLSGFGVSTIGIRHSPEKGGPSDEVVGYDRLHPALKRADYLVLTCPLTDLTRGLIGDSEFDTLPNDAVVINVARGKVVMTNALISAIQSEFIGGAALDVTDPEPLPEDHPLWGFDNVVITPHNAGSSISHWGRVAELLARNLDSVDENGEYVDLTNQVV